MGNRYHVFLSHSSADSELVLRLLHELQDYGLRVWCDTDKGERDQAWRSDDDRRGKLLAGTISHMSNNRQTSIETVAAFINTHICLGEFIEWRGKEIGNNTIDKYKKEFADLFLKLGDLRSEILERFWRAITVSRRPVGHCMTARKRTQKSPWLVRVVEHLQRIVESEEYRNRELEKLDSRQEMARNGVKSFQVVREYKIQKIRY